MANTTLNSEYIANRYVANNTSCFRPVALLCSAREVLQKGFPLGEESCKQFGALATDEGGSISAYHSTKRYSKFHSIETERHMGRSLQYSARHSRKALYPNASHPQNERDSRTLQKTPSKTQKLPPRAPAQNKTNQIFAMQRRVRLGEVLGERGRFGGREPPLRKRGLSPSKVFPPSPPKIFIVPLAKRRG